MSPRNQVAFRYRSVMDQVEAKFLIDDGCWPWIAGKSSDGYGRVREQNAHRVVYELFRGPIPSGLQLDHLCRRRDCVRPDHLEAVTQTENTRRAPHPRGEEHHHGALKHCPQGHPYDDINTYVLVDRHGTHRTCRKCNNANSKAYRARRKAQAAML